MSTSEDIARPAERSDPAGQAGVGWRRIVGGLGLALLSCVLLIVSWQAFGDLWWLVGVAFVPMYVAQYRILPRRWSGVPVGMAFGAYWLAMIMQGSSVLPVPVIVAFALVMALIGWLVGIFLRPFTLRTGYRWFIVQLPLLWVGFDVLIADNEIFGSYSWIAYRLAEAPQIIQPVSLVSTPALSFLIIMWNAWLALLVIRAMDAKWPQLADQPVPGNVIRWTSVITVCTATAWLVSSLVLYQQVSHTMGPPVRVAAVQPGLHNAWAGTLISLGNPTPGRSNAQRERDQIAELTRMTQQAADQGAALVVWPEEVLDYDPRVKHPSFIPDLVRATGVYLVQGFVLDPTDGASPNVALMWSPQGQVIGVYKKVHRVLAEGERFAPGTAFPTVETELGPLGMIICFDIDFPNSSPRLVALTGSEIIAAPSIDFPSGAYVRTASTVFRAVENRVGMVKADVAWDSVVVAPNGQVLGRTLDPNPAGKQALLVQDLPRAPRGAPFTQLGGAPFAVILWFFVVWMIVAMVRTSRRRRGDRPAPA